MIKKLKENYLLIILAIFFLVHLIGINSPILDAHSWRQSDTITVAKNFLEESNNIFYPRVDIRGEFSGITGMEFPIYNYLVYILFIFFGVSFWPARMLTLLIALVGIYYFNKFVVERYGPKKALIPTLFLISSPLFFYFSRNIQPDILMLSLTMASLYFGQKYAKSQKLHEVVLSALLLCLAMLVKLPAVFFLPALAVILIEKKRYSAKDIWLYVILAIVSAIPIYLWYSHSSNLSSDYGLGTYYYNGFEIGKVIDTLKDFYFWSHVFVLRYFASTATIIGGLLAIIGFFVAISKKRYFELVLCISLFIFTLAFSNKFLPHIYYSLIFVPLISLLSMFGVEWFLSRFSEKRGKTLLTVAFILIFANTLVRSSFWYKFDRPEYLNLRQISEENIASEDRIIVNGEGNPVMLFFAGRKGWSPHINLLSNEYIAETGSRGADYIIIDKDNNYPEIVYDENLIIKYEDDDFRLIKIER